MALISETELLALHKNSAAPLELQLPVLALRWADSSLRAAAVRAGTVALPNENARRLFEE